MNSLKLAEYNSAGLLPLVNTISKNYYDVIEKLCSGAISNTNKIMDLEINHAASNYIKFCNQLSSEILHHIKSRKEYFIPYINELQEKEAASHNCGNCSGKCHLQHQFKLVELTDSQTKMQYILNQLQKMTIPVHSDTNYPVAYRVLSSQMVLLENALNELFFVEETYLIPKVVLAQQKINANG